MEFLQQAIDLILHLDVYLDLIIDRYGIFTYLLLFLIIFCETGLVIMPFLPGDSLLFAAGAFAAKGSLSIAVLFFLLGFAAIAGDSLNYAIGAYVGPKLFMDKLHLLKKEHLDRAHVFYERYGAKAIVFARFIPILRTVVPFVAGVAKMTYPNFVYYNVLGGLIWITLFLLGGFFFGSISFVEKNFSLVILAIIVLSILPAVTEVTRQWLTRRKPQRM